MQYKDIINRIYIYIVKKYKINIIFVLALIHERMACQRIVLLHVSTKASTQILY